MLAIAQATSPSCPSKWVFHMFVFLTILRVTETLGLRPWRGWTGGPGDTGLRLGCAKETVSGSLAKVNFAGVEWQLLRF